MTFSVKSSKVGVTSKRIAIQPTRKTCSGDEPAQAQNYLKRVFSSKILNSNLKHSQFRMSSIRLGVAGTKSCKASKTQKTVKSRPAQKANFLGWPGFELTSSISSWDQHIFLSFEHFTTKILVSLGLKLQHGPGEITLAGSAQLTSSS